MVANGFKHDLQIERIRILGLGKPGSKWQAEIAKRQQSLEGAWGPLHLNEGLPDNAYVIRKPELALSEKWTLNFMKEGLGIF